MATRNAITGDEIKSRANSKEYLDSHERIFGETKVQRGRYRWDSELKKFVPIHEWAKKYAEPPKPRGPMISVSNFDAFESPASGKLIRNKREYLDDLKATGCRPYEGKEREKAEADRYLKAKDENLVKAVEETVEETAYELEHGYRQPSETESLNVTFGE